MRKATKGTKAKTGTKATKGTKGTKAGAFFHSFALVAFLAFVALVALIVASLQAAVFSRRQMEEIKCAGVEMQLFYYYLVPDRDPKILNYKVDCRRTPVFIKMPAWIDQDLSRMMSRKVWRDPEEGNLSEAALWQTTVSILFQFFDLTKKTFPQSEKGAGIQPGLLVKEYADIRIRFQMSLDRVYRARGLKDSFGGRGRGLLATFDLILKEMESIADAISSTNAKRYADSVTAIAVLSQDSFNQLLHRPRGMASPKISKKSELFQKIIPYLLTILGVIIVFLGVRVFFSINKDRIDQMSEEYIRKSRQWTEDFNRQFMQVKVEYLVMAPVGLFALMGLLTFSLIGFILLTAIGIYLGLHMPVWILNYMKKRRGRKIDMQLMDALVLLSNSLRSGLDIVQGFEMVSKDLLPPISDEYGLVIRNYQLGTPFEKALEGMEERVASRLLSYMIKAIILQRQVGGNLTRIFERIVENIREEGKLEEKTKALTAQQKIQSIVVAVMPWVMLAVMFVFQGAIMANFYFSPIGALTIFLCAVWIAIGMKFVQRLGNIRV